jgi:anti-anti-sigma factor
MASPATGEVALDMARVDFIDCAGVHMLIALDRDIQIRGGSMRIVAISPAAALLFELVYAVGALPGFYTPVPPTPGLSVSSHS